LTQAAQAVLAEAEVPVVTPQVLAEAVEAAAPVMLAVTVPAVLVAHPVQAAQAE
jgi:hypothetical protein